MLQSIYHIADKRKIMWSGNPDINNIVPHYGGIEMKKFFTTIGILGLGAMGYSSVKYIMDVKKILDEDPELANEFKLAGYQGKPAEEVARRVQKMRDIRLAKRLAKVSDRLGACKQDVEARLAELNKKKKEEGKEETTAVEAEIVTEEK